MAADHGQRQVDQGQDDAVSVAVLGSGRAEGIGEGGEGAEHALVAQVAAYAPGTWVRFAFSGPRGFNGFHEFAVLPVDGQHTVLRHTLAMRTRGPARLSWPLAFRWMHDACLEDSLDRAEAACTGTVSHPSRWSPYVRLLRALAR